MLSSAEKADVRLVDLVKTQDVALDLRDTCALFNTIVPSTLIHQ
jgi:hypothetical protein